MVDFNAFFDTGVPVPVHNKARKIDSLMANGLESLPGFAGMMAILATRNLRRALALGLPSGQGMANSVGIAPMTAAQLTSGLPANEVAVLNPGCPVGDAGPRGGTDLTSLWLRFNSALANSRVQPMANN